MARRNGYDQIWCELTLPQILYDMQHKGMYNTICEGIFYGTDIGNNICYIKVCDFSHERWKSYRTQSDVQRDYTQPSVL